MNPRDYLTKHADLLTKLNLPIWKLPKLCVTLQSQ